MYSKGRKGNPYHDRMGRFCSGANMTSGVVYENDGTRITYYKKDGKFYHSHEEKHGKKWTKIFGEETTKEDFREFESKVKADAVKREVEEAVRNGDGMPFYQDEERTDIKMRYLNKMFGDTKENAERRYAETYSVDMGGKTRIFGKTKMLIDGNGNAYYRAVDEEGQTRTIPQTTYDRRKTAPWHTDPLYRDKKNGRIMWLMDHPDSVYNDNTLIMSLKNIQYMADRKVPVSERHKALEKISANYGIDMETLREMVGSEFVDRRQK